MGGLAGFCKAGFDPFGLDAPQTCVQFIAGIGDRQCYRPAEHRCYGGQTWPDGFHPRHGLVRSCWSEDHRSLQCRAMGLRRQVCLLSMLHRNNGRLCQGVPRLLDKRETLGPAAMLFRTFNCGTVSERALSQ